MRAAIAQILVRGVIRLAAQGPRRTWPLSLCLDFRAKLLIFSYKKILFMTKSICSEVSLENPYFKLKIGTIDKKKPTTFYVEGGTFITPVDDDDDELSYKDRMAIVYKDMAKGIQLVVSESKLNRDFIANIDVADERMKVGKKTYFTFQYYLRQNGELVPFAEIAENGDEYTKSVLARLEYSLKENGFALSKTKN